jgi:oxygen-independent coproporphyrinogen-3 oxidase
MEIGSPYQSYLYGYPHKTAYRALAPPVPLQQAWAQEDKSALFLYLHVPFCEMRCGFCNLFTTVNPDEDLVEAWLAALSRQARAVAEGVGAARYARVVLGGGTPTFLTEGQLERAFDLVESMGAEPLQVPVGCEVSPSTCTPERLAVLRRRGVDRASIGVQSFLPPEAKAAGRPQDLATVHSALDLLREMGFPVLNIDLIYGIEGQTEESFVASLRAALRWAPEELYLYPLYVRPLTGLGRRALTGEFPEWDEQRLRLYRAGRAFLRGEGYRQVSMRMFKKGQDLDGPVYRCQEDGMVGLGVGARSYTRELHWSTEYAVAQGGVRSIVRGYVGQQDFSRADWGFRLDGEEQRRRYVALSLLSEGVEREGYRQRFGTELDADLPALADLQRWGLATDDGLRLVLTDAGVERADAIGPWLFSERVKGLMREWEAR